MEKKLLVRQDFYEYHQREQQDSLTNFNTYNKRDDTYLKIPR